MEPANNNLIKNGEKMKKKKEEIFIPEKFGFEKWNINSIITTKDSRFNLFINNNHKIYHLTQKKNKIWIIELIKEKERKILYQGHILTNRFAFELFNNFEFTIPNLHDLDI